MKTLALLLRSGLTMKQKYLRFLGFSALLGFVLASTSGAAQAMTLEEQAKSLETSVQTVEQRRRSAIKGLKVDVLQAYRDSMVIESVETRVGEVFDRTARVDVKVTYSFDFEKAKLARENLSKYFDTATDKRPGVEPYGMIYTNFPDCVGAYCTVKTEMTKYLKWSAVGVNVSFMGIPGVFVTTQGDGMYDLKPGSVTIQFDVPKSKIKGDPKPVVKAQVFDIHFCPGDPDCSGYRYTIQK